MTFELFLTCAFGAYVGAAVSNLMFEQERQEKAENRYRITPDELERIRKQKMELAEQKRWS